MWLQEKKDRNIRCTLCGFEGKESDLKRKLLSEFDGNEELLYICPKCKREYGIVFFIS